MDSLLNPILSLTYQQLASLANTYSAWDVFDTAFGSMYNSEKVTVLLSQWKSGDFSGFPPVEIRSRSEINGANGAFAAATGKIYLAQEFIDANVDQPEVIAAVLLEEYGHYIDSQINLTDSAGDEGNIFARLVQGESISEPELAVLKAEDDTATIVINNQIIEVEQSVQTTSQFITLIEPTTTTPILGYGSDFEDIIQLHAYNSQSPGFVQRAWGYGGADIFNVTFDTPSNGEVGINFNTGNLKKLDMTWKRMKRGLSKSADEWELEVKLPKIKDLCWSDKRVKRQT